MKENCFLDDNKIFNFVTEIWCYMLPCLHYAEYGIDIKYDT